MRYTIEGGSLPAVIIQLDAGEKLLSEVGGRTWARGPIRTETKAEGGAGKALGRMFMGESLFMSVYTAEDAGESIVCQKRAFLCASYGVELAIHFQKKLGAGLVGGEGFIMQRITGPGIVFLEVDGYCQEYDLRPGERLVCDTGVLAIMDATCTMDVQVVRGAKNVLLGGEGLFDTVITGPGKVFLQTMTIPKLAGQMIPYLPFKKE